MGSTPNCARQSETLAAASTALFVCTAADTTLPCDFASLPLPVALSIFALLPADARARAAAVCQAWRHALTAEPSAWKLWTELDLSEKSGITCARGDAALEGAAALARGRLRTLKLHEFGGSYKPHTVTDAALLRVVAANARLEELTYMRAGAAWATVEQLQALLAAAPALQRLAIGVIAYNAASARALLRREPPYAALRLDQLSLYDTSAASPLRTADGVIALAADVAACGSLRSLHVYHAALEAPAALEALVDAVLARGLLYVHLYTCTFASAVALPQLARLLADGRSKLRTLRIQDCPTLFAADQQQQEMAALCDALTKCNTLKRLYLKNGGLHAAAHMPVALLLQRALASRPAGSPAVVTVE